MGGDYLSSGSRMLRLSTSAALVKLSTSSKKKMFISTRIAKILIYNKVCPMYNISKQSKIYSLIQLINYIGFCYGIILFRESPALLVVSSLWAVDLVFCLWVILLLMLFI